MSPSRLQNRKTRHAVDVNVICSSRSASYTRKKTARGEPGVVVGRGAEGTGAGLEGDARKEQKFLLLLPPRQRQIDEKREQRRAGVGEWWGRDG